ncbi:MAG: murein biosynthesis integral membrane protein MurJ [Bacteroidetes bacterium]|nr:murein biosynthesis integral membrane protein MurJ [Bacteroidota bacterium]
MSSSSVADSSEASSKTQSGSGRSAFLVAAGILLSRIAGLVRERVFAYYFGNSAAADAFKSAFRIPNFLQNLFGEGVLSASFIPVYAGLLARGDEKEAGRVAGAIAAILGLVVSLLVLAGVLATPWMIDLIAPGFSGDKRELTISLVRILFPGAGLLVLSAWCLGILNSHRRFFLSYTAPVIWNVAMILTLVFFGRRMDQYPLAQALAWGSVGGSLLQLLVQLPSVLRLVRHLRIALALRLPNVRTVVTNFMPAFIGRGVVQISAYIDNVLASLLPDGAVAALGYAQTLYTLPVSLFGMAISAAELPAMSSATGSAEEIAVYLRSRLDSGLHRIAFFIVPSSMAFLALGDVVTGAIFQSGKFTHDDSVYVWIVLAGSTVGLLASTLGRLYASTYYALRDTRTPLRFALIRVALTTVMGYICAVPLIKLLGIDPRWGTAGLTVSAGLAGWIEFTMLRRTLNARIGRTGLHIRYVAQLWGSAIVAAAAGWGIKLLVGHAHPLVMAAAVLIPYGVLYFVCASLLRIPEAASVAGRIRRLLQRMKR